MTGLDFDILYDPFIVSFTGAFSGNFDLFVGTSTIDPVLYPDGTVHLDNYDELLNYAINFEDPPVNNGNITIAALTFDALVPGTSLLSGSGDYSDAGPSYVPVEGSGTVNVVPIPPSMLMLGSGLLGPVGFRRKFKKA